MSTFLVEGRLCLTKVSAMLPGAFTCWSRGSPVSLLNPELFLLTLFFIHFLFKTTRFSSAEGTWTVHSVHLFCSNARIDGVTVSYNFKKETAGGRLERSSQGKLGKSN